jgi:hypothetical protein
VRGKGEDPAGKFLEFLRRDASPETETLVRGLVEAATERSTHTAELVAKPRHLNHPAARRLLAVWAVLNEYTRNRMANSRKLWHGDKYAGGAGGIAGRVGGVCASTVERDLDRLQAAGVIKRWQAKPFTSGVVRVGDEGGGHCYQSYLLFVVPRSVERAVRGHYERLKRAAPPPESIPRAVVAPPASVPAWVRAVVTNDAAPASSRPPSSAGPPPVPDERVRTARAPGWTSKLIPT